MTLEWFRPRQYKHFDRPVCEVFAQKVVSPSFVERHAFSPLIHYEKLTKRYKRKDKRTEVKSRPIKYASHRDACILSFYSSQLNDRLNDFYAQNSLGKNIIAYRALGMANYDFSAAAYKYALENSPCMILAFDVSGFFDNLDHRLLKWKLKQILGVESLSSDWLRVFRFVTRFHFVELDMLKAHPVFARQLKERGTEPIATVAQLKAAEIPFHTNQRKTAGIPQGTPISAALSNLYMIDFDVKVRDYCDRVGAFYRRYSDDVLIICPLDRANDAELKIGELISENRLELSKDKTERTAFDPASSSSFGDKAAQYLGFSYYPDGAGIRSTSLSRQWRKMRRSIRKAKQVADWAIKNGRATKVFTKKLRRRFAPLQFRNFSSYARRSAKVFGNSEKITNQIRRLERAFDQEMRSLKDLPTD